LQDIAEMFIGPNIGLFAPHYIVKPPLIGKVMRWHQDGVFWPLEPMEVVTIWPAVDVDVDVDDAIYMVLQPGDVEVDHPMLFHASNANTSANRRAGLTILYIPSSTRITNDVIVSQAAFHLRGETRVNKNLAFPQYREGTYFPFRAPRPGHSRKLATMEGARSGAAPSIVSGAPGSATMDRSSSIRSSDTAIDSIQGGVETDVVHRAD
jgi:hypothetical protein